MLTVFQQVLSMVNSIRLMIRPNIYRHSQIASAVAVHNRQDALKALIRHLSFDYSKHLIFKIMNKTIITCHMSQCKQINVNERQTFE